MIYGWMRSTKAVCIGSGPSLSEDDCQLVGRSGLYTVAVNSSWKLARFCDVIYAGDYCWWDKYRHEIDIPAERWTCLERPSLEFGLNRHGDFRGVTNSGARAIEFLVEKGFKEIILLGFDCSINKGVHWHGPHDKTPNPTKVKCDRWAGQFAIIAGIAKRDGVDIVNCSRETVLTCFRRSSLLEAL